ncbi:MAG: DUF309 domain-containing protein [Bacillota bacterium]|nr:DUF309 domain-containing protein [Bacillota bacterium]
MRTWPEAYRRFVELFNEGRYFESHEVLEDLWRARGHDPFYQALIIVAAAHVHAGRGNPRGFRRHLQQALRLLAPYPDRFRGLDVGALRGWIQETLERQAAVPDALPGLGLAPLPPLELAPPTGEAEAEEEGSG